MLTYKNILTLLFCSAFLLFLCALFCFCSACVYGLFFFCFFGTPHAKAEESHILLTIKQNHGKRWRVKRAVQKIVISNCCCAIFFSSSSSQLPSSLSLLLIVLYIIVITILCCYCDHYYDHYLCYCGGYLKLLLRDLLQLIIFHCHHVGHIRY